MSEAPDFTPTTIKLQGKDYLEVAQRVLWLRRDHPDAQIVTDVVEHDRAEGWALVKAIITLPGGAVATGYGTASRKDLRGPVALAYLEKGETRAIGRACAALGYGTLAALTEDGDTLADAPVERPAAARSVPTPKAVHLPAHLVAVEVQSEIRGLVAALAWGTEDVGKLLKHFGVTRFSQLSPDDLQAVLIDLRAQVAALAEDAAVPAGR